MTPIFNAVSIPSSSGHQFTGRAVKKNPGEIYMFQSLLHQGISLLVAPDVGLERLLPVFQSLLHQGISLLVGYDASIGDAARGVSIPSSSGHQFTVVDMGVENNLFAAFQSLLHQGISLLVVPVPHGRRRHRRRFNPFFIRASVYWTALLAKQGLSLQGFNPFFIRASVYWALMPFALQVVPDRVSIPSSSGHQFTARRNANLNKIEIPEFQSLLHQGISLLGLQFGPQFRRPELWFQSLLHQGISLLGTDHKHAVQKHEKGVSIPSSSGHQFTGRKNLRFLTRNSPGFQSLLHQGISLLAQQLIAVSASAVCWFQSLLHQGISLLSAYQAYTAKGACRGFNPFFIRASVYWQICPIELLPEPSACFNPFFIRASVYWLLSPSRRTWTQ